MVNDSSEDSSSLKRSAGSRIIQQWGGRFAFFFCYMHLSHDLTTGLLSALLPFIREDLGLNYLQSGFLVTAFALTSGLSQLLGGWVSDRITKRRAIALGLIGVGLSAVAVFFASSYISMLTILIILGLFAGFYHPSGISALTTHIEPQRRGKAVALHMLGGSLGFGIGPLLGAVIASSLNWHFAYLFLGLPALLAAVMALRYLKLTPVPKPVKTTSSLGDGKKPAGIWQVFKPIMAVISISVIMQLATGPIMSFVSLFLIDIHLMTAASASMWMTIIRFGSLSGNLIGGWLMDKWGRQKTIYLILCLFGPIVLGIVMLPSGIPLAIALVLFGCLMTMREATMQTLLMDNSPPHLRATIIGIYFGFGQQGSSIIQPVAGDFMDSIGILGVFNGIAYISIGLSLVAALLALRYIRKNRNTVALPPS